MFEERKIFYFTPFHFKKGGSKNKFFLILKNIDGVKLIISLPSSQSYIQDEHNKESGCIDIEDCCINCFIISKDDVITDCGKSFSKKTHIYGQNLDFDNTENLSNRYKIEGRDYEVFGVMQESIFNDYIDQTMLTIEDAIDDSGEDIDYDTIAGILTLEFADRSKIIINRQAANLQLWIAARSGGFHLDYVDDQWFCKKENCSLQILLDRLCSEQAKSEIHLPLI